VRWTTSETYARESEIRATALARNSRCRSPSKVGMRQAANRFTRASEISPRAHSSADGTLHVRDWKICFGQRPVSDHERTKLVTGHWWLLPLDFSPLSGVSVGQNLHIIHPFECRRAMSIDRAVRKPSRPLPTD
jgi:hypothetical protein